LLQHRGKSTQPGSLWWPDSIAAWICHHDPAKSIRGTIVDGWRPRVPGRRQVPVLLLPAGGRSIVVAARSTGTSCGWARRLAGGAWPERQASLGGNRGSCSATTDVIFLAELTGLFGNNWANP
jgi:hypothetical protein